MGVDLAVIKAEGFLIPLKETPKEVLEDLHKCARRSEEEAESEEDSDSEEESAEESEGDDEEDDDNSSAKDAEHSEPNKRPNKKTKVEESVKKKPVRFMTQEGALSGTSVSYEPFGLLIPPGNKVKTILNEKVGPTPMSFAVTGVYSGSGQVKGGANIPFVVKSYEGEVDPDTKARDVLRQGKLDGVGLSKKTLKWLEQEKGVDYGLFLFSYFC